MVAVPGCTRNNKASPPARTAGGDVTAGPPGPESSAFVLLRHRPVVEHTFDALHDRGSQQLDDSTGLHVLLHLLRRGGPGDDGGYVRVLQAPGERELCGAATELLRDLAEQPHLADHLGTLVRLEPLAQEVDALERQPAAFGDAVVVFAGQEAARQRTPGGQAQAERVVQARVLDFDAFAFEHVVLRLLHRRADEVLAARHLVRFADLLGGPFARAPVERLALVDQEVHGADRLLDRGVQVGAVAEQQVDVVKLHPLQRGIRSLDHVLAGQALVVRAVAAPEDLGRDDQVLAFPAGPLYHVAHHHFSLARGVTFGVVEEVHAGIPGRAHAFVSDVLADLRTARDPRAERQLGYLQT